MMCWRCNSDDIKVVQDQKKWRFPFWVTPLLYLLIGMIILISIGLLFVKVIAAVIFFFVALGCLTFAVYVLKCYFEKRNDHTRTKCICRNCGYTWYLD